MITLLSPQVVVVGGGVPLAGETLFFTPLRQEVERYVFPPLRGTYRIAAAELGEEGGSSRNAGAWPGLKRKTETHAACSFLKMNKTFSAIFQKGNTR